jgi:glycosyltransferase involved in cell wall biosynthesis
VRVLHVTAYYAPAFVFGGPPRTVHGLCQALGRQGIHVQVFTTDADGAGRLPKGVTEAGLFEDVPVRYFRRSWPNRPIGSRELAVALRSEVAEHDVVHIHGLWNRVVWAAASEARRSGVPYVLSPRGMLEDAALAHRSWQKRLACALVERQTVQGAALLHATSEREVETLHGLRGRAPIVLVPNGIEPPEVPGSGFQVPGSGFQVRRHLGLPENAPLIVFIGRLHPIKRLDLLIDAFALLRARHPDARLVIAGPDEAGLRSGLDARAGSAAGAITWLGAIDETKRDSLLRETSALVLCSDSESFGMSVLEAMASAVPVVVTRTCGWSDVERYGAGHLVEQHADAIADALASLLDNPSAASAIGLRGRTLVLSKYRWDTVARAFLSEYASLATRRVASPVRAAL